MPRRGWITGSIALPVSNYVYRIVRLPIDEMLIGAFNGALAELGLTSNWEQVTGLETPDEAAEIMRDLLISMVDTGSVKPMITPKWARVRFGAEVLNNLSLKVLTPTGVDQWSHPEYQDVINPPGTTIVLPEPGFYTLSFVVATLPVNDLRGLDTGIFNPSAGVAAAFDRRSVYNPLGLNLQWLASDSQPLYIENAGHEIDLRVTPERASGGTVTIDSITTRLVIANWGETPYFEA